MKKIIHAILLIALVLSLTSCIFMFDKMEVYSRSFNSWDFNSVYINLVSENVSIERSDTNSIKVVIKSTTTNDRIFPSVVNYNKELRILDQSGNNPPFAAYNSDVIVYIPDSFTNKPFTINTVSGSISASSIRPFSFAISSVSGSVNVSLNEIFKSSSSISTVSGSISVYLPSGFRHYYRTTSGSVYNGFTGITVYGSGHIDCFASSPVLSTETVSGSIKVMRR